MFVIDEPKICISTNNLSWQKKKWTKASKIYKLLTEEVDMYSTIYRKLNKLSNSI